MPQEQFSDRETSKLAITSSSLVLKAVSTFLLYWDLLLLWGAECWFVPICYGAVAAVGVTGRTKPFNCQSNLQKKCLTPSGQCVMGMVSSGRKGWRLSTGRGKELQSVTASLWSCFVYWANISYNSFILTNGGEKAIYIWKPLTMSFPSRVLHGAVMYRCSFCSK